MEKIIKYMATDGSEWFSEVDCIKREEMIVKVKAAMLCLKPTPIECNWNGYVKQSQEDVIRCKERLFALSSQDGILKSWIDEQKQTHGKTDRELIEVCHPSWFGRMLDGSCEPLERAYWRMCCIDTEFREWNQPYYADHPEHAEMICVG